MGGVGNGVMEEAQGPDLNSSVAAILGSWPYGLGRRQALGHAVRKGAEGP